MTLVCCVVKPVWGMEFYQWRLCANSISQNYVFCSGDTPHLLSAFLHLHFFSGENCGAFDRARSHAVRLSTFQNTSIFFLLTLVVMLLHAVALEQHILSTFAPVDRVLGLLSKEAILRLRLVFPLPFPWKGDEFPFLCPG